MTIESHSSPLARRYCRVRRPSSTDDLAAGHRHDRASAGAGEPLTGDLADNGDGACYDDLAAIMKKGREPARPRTLAAFTESGAVAPCGFHAT